MQNSRLGTLGLLILKKGERIKSYWKPDTTVCVCGGGNWGGELPTELSGY